MESKVGLTTLLLFFATYLDFSLQDVEVPPQLFPTLDSKPDDTVVPYEFPGGDGKLKTNVSFAPEKPPKIFPKSGGGYGDKKSNKSKAVPVVPLEFPENPSSNYTFVVNSTIRENLAQRAEEQNTTDTEVPDLLKPGLEFVPELVVTTPENEIKDKESEETVPNAAAAATEDPKSEVEMLQDVDSKANEDDKFADVNLAEMHSAHDHYQRIGVPLVHGQLAIVMSIVFVALAIIAYVGLVTWRKFLENRYGNRELLVNEDVYDPNDLRNFEL